MSTEDDIKNHKFSKYIKQAVMPKMSLDVIRADKSSAQIFTELTGGCWHERGKRGRFTEICCKCGKKYKRNPTYQNVADILRVMEARKDYYDFMEYIANRIDYQIPMNVLVYFINDYILNPSALLERAIEFLKKGEWNVTDYSKFPFENFTTKEVAKLMLEAIQLKDDDFAIACRENLKTRKDVFKQNPDLEEADHEGSI